MFLQVVARFSLFFHVFGWFCVFFCVFALLGHFRPLLGHYLGALGRSWGSLEAVLGALGTLLGQSWDAFGALLGPCWDYPAKNPKKLEKNPKFCTNLGGKMDAKMEKNRCKKPTLVRTCFFNVFLQISFDFWTDISMVFRSNFQLIAKTSTL